MGEVQTNGTAALAVQVGAVAREVTEKLIVSLAWLLPRRLAYWAFIRVATSGTDGKPYEFNPGDRTCGDAAQRFT